MYPKYALLFHRPSVWMRWSGIPLHAATVAAPILKLWLTKLPGISAPEKMDLSQEDRSYLDNDWLFSSKSNGIEAPPLLCK
jgi:hypothetical protein